MSERGSSPELKLISNIEADKLAEQFSQKADLERTVGEIFYTSLDHLEAEGVGTVTNEILTKFCQLNKSAIEGKSYPDYSDSLSSQTALKDIIIISDRRDSWASIDRPFIKNCLDEYLMERVGGVIGKEKKPFQISEDRGRKFALYKTKLKGPIFDGVFVERVDEEGYSEKPSSLIFLYKNEIKALSGNQKEK